MKNEIKVEFDNSEQLISLIEDVYFADGTLGKLVGKKSHLLVDESDILHTIFKGMDNMICRLTNNDVIDGSLRIVVNEENNVITLHPVSIYCVKEDKYSFY